jgi:hypothetical protein
LDIPAAVVPARAAAWDIPAAALPAWAAATLADRERHMAAAGTERRSIGTTKNWNDEDLAEQARGALRFALSEIVSRLFPRWMTCKG